MLGYHIQVMKEGPCSIYMLCETVYCRLYGKTNYYPILKRHAKTIYVTVTENKCIEEIKKITCYKGSLVGLGCVYKNYEKGVSR